jgi:hypothetical protein
LQHGITQGSAGVGRLLCRASPGWGSLGQPVQGVARVGQPVQGSAGVGQPVQGFASEGGHPAQGFTRVGARMVHVVCNAQIVI